MAVLTIHAEEAINLVAALAKKTGKTTDAVLIEALQHQLATGHIDSDGPIGEEYRSSDPLDVRLARVAQAQLHFSQLPIPDGMSMDDWMYDDYGLPR